MDTCTECFLSLMPCPVFNLLADCEDVIAFVSELLLQSYMCCLFDLKISSRVLADRLKDIVLGASVYLISEELEIELSYQDHIWVEKYR